MTATPDISDKESILHKCLKQALYLYAYFLVGLILTARGTCFLDLVQLYDSSILYISYAVLITGVGAIFSTISIGYLDTLFPNYGLLSLLVLHLVTTFSVGLMANFRHILGFFVVSFGAGIGMAAALAQCRTLCLYTWRNTKWGPGPFLHSLFVMQSVGFFVAPIVSKPFLSVREENNDDQELSETRITILFPIFGALALLAAIGYLAASICYEMRGGKASSPNEATSAQSPVGVASMSSRDLVLSAIVLLCFFLDYSFQMGVANFIIKTFQSGPLGLSKKQGADVQTMYYLGQLMSRLLSIFASMVVPPNLILSIVLTLGLGSSLTLLLYPWPTLTLVKVLYALLGLGVGSLLGTSLLWLEQFTQVGSGISSLASTAASFGFIASMLLFGNLVELVPQLLLYFQLCVVCLDIVVFGVGTIIGNSKKKAENGNNQGGNEEQVGQSNNAFETNAT